jgi:hypothetical protein
MSDIDPQHPAVRSELTEPEWFLRQRWRTQRLFDLAVAASGLDSKRVARAMRIDIRSLGEMRELPTLHYIARIAEVLGIDAGSAADVIGSGSDPLVLRRENEAPLPEQVACADLEDDSGALRALAERLGATAREPSDLALSILCAARADAASGEACTARERARVALDIGISPMWRLVADTIIDAIEIDAMLGEAWLPIDPARIAAFPAIAPHRPRHPRRDALTDPARARAAAGSLALQMLQSALRREGGACERIAELRFFLGEASEHGCARTVAWSASIAGIAALRLRECAALSARDERAAMSLFVSAQFAIDERIAALDAHAPMPLLRRRLHLALHEWCDRARRGELAEALLDEVDDREVKAMFVRFPRARTA